MSELVVYEAAAPEANLAFDEALVRAVPELPVLWIWHNPRCVVIGRGQRPHREADLDACARDGVPVLRRGSGGGAVYHDAGNVNISLALPGTPEPLHALTELMTGLLADLGVPAVPGTRGMFVAGRKLCGFAALRTRGAVLAHSTLLVSASPEAVGRYLAPAPAEAHPLDSHRSPVTSLAELGIAPPDVAASLARRLGPLREREPSRSERHHQLRLLWSRYGHRPWHETGTQRKEERWTSAPASICTA